MMQPFTISSKVVDHIEICVCSSFNTHEEKESRHGKLIFTPEVPIFQCSMNPWAYRTPTQGKN
jgi:hypothetical protein